MPEYPEALSHILEDFRWLTDRNERADYLIELADQFQDVPEHIAIRPYPEANRVPFCESETYVWAEDRPDGALDFFIAVENPQGISAKAMAVIVLQTLFGKPLEQVAQVSSDIVYTVFGKNISMGKGQGLMGIVNMVRKLALDRLSQQE